MQNSKYLSIGSIIVKKYEIIDFLGEDEFEILYLVRDLHRKGSFFVLKELFLETFSSRKNQLVYTLPEAEGVFNKRRKQIIEEIEAQKLNLNLNEIKVYGYEEDNQTIYTIMEFSNNANLEKYLQYIAKDGSRLPSLDELVNQENKGINYFFFLKILLLLGILLAIAFYAYEYFQKENMKDKLDISATMQYPKLKDRSTPKENISVQETIMENKPPVEFLVDEILIKDEDNSSTQLELINKVKIEENLTKEIKLVSQDVDMNISKVDINKTVIVKKITIEENLTKVDDMLISETLIKSFLDTYINASATSEEGTLKFYDKDVKRYFKFKNPTHQTIMNSQKRYNRKWLKREFQISNFEIVKSYKKDDINHYDIKTTTVWNVSNNGAKKYSGKSKGFMSLKEVENGFKIISIYTLK